MPTEKERIHYFDVLRACKDYAAEVAFFEKLFAKFSSRKIERILLVGCKTGGHVDALHASYAVFCLDNDPQFITAAKSRYKKVDFFTEEYSSFALDRTFDAIVCPFRVFNSLVTEEAVRGFLSSCAAHLEAGGVLLFDYLAPCSGLHLDVGSLDGVDLARLTQWTPNGHLVSAVRSTWVSAKKKKDFFVATATYLSYPVKRLAPVVKKSGFSKVKMFNGFSLDSYDASPVAVFCAIKK